MNPDIANDDEDDGTGARVTRASASAKIDATTDRVSASWGTHDRIIAEDDLRDGKIAEVLRWCRDRLGGQDQDLVGPLRWAEACDNGWSERATYACLPACGPRKTWQRYVHDLAHYVHVMLSGRDGSRNYDNYSLSLELELADLVAGWLADEACGVKRSFPPLVLSRPTDLTA